MRCEHWPRHGDIVRSDSSLGYRPPAWETIGVRTRGAAAWPASVAPRPGRQRGRSTEFSDTMWSVQWRRSDFAEVCENVAPADVRRKNAQMLGNDF